MNKLPNQPELRAEILRNLHVYRGWTSDVDAKKDEKDRVNALLALFRETMEEIIGEDEVIKHQNAKGEWEVTEPLFYEPEEQAVYELRAAQREQLEKVLGK